MSTLKEICKEQTEMIDEMRQNIKELTKESDQYKAERDTLIDDIAVLKANISRLEREKEQFKESHIKHIVNMENYYKDRVQKFKEENKALRLQSDTYFEQWQEAEKQRSEFNLYVNLYATLTNHIRMKAEANPGVSRYIDLVNYIDRLEGGDDEI